MHARKKIPLRVVSAPSSENVLVAPPPVIAIDHIVDYTCGKCDVTLVLAEENGIHDVLIQCMECGSYNRLD